ncbi:MAG: polymer-forming cytoskeletal protein [Elusimicrobia bacterium]|nr:polymer-forming cytoskeletal protein [Elusimicrobiota bacterium]
MNTFLRRFLCILALLLPLSAWQAQAAKNTEPRHAPVTVGPQEVLEEDILTDAPVTIDGKLSGKCTSLGAPVSVSGSVEGDVSSLGGPVSISGLVKGDVFSAGNNIDVTGTVRGDVAAIGGNVVLRDSATVIGDISTIGGHIERGGKVVIKGAVNSTDVKMLGRMMPRLLRSGFSGSGDGLKALLLGSAFGLAGLAILSSVLVSALLLFLIPPVFFPKNVELSAECIRRDPWRCAGMGALIALLTTPALLSLAISIVGLPLIPLALLLLLISAILGFSAFAVVLAERFFTGIKKPVPDTLLKRVGAGYLLSAGLLFFGRMLPFIGGLLALAGLIVMVSGLVLGLGSALVTRLGTELKLPKQVQQP